MTLLTKIRMDTTERLLYLSFGLTILVTAALISGLLILRAQNTSQSALLNAAITKLNNQATDIKNLGIDNKTLNQRGIDYAHCNAVIIATYTQTLQPITIKDLEKCVIESSKATSGSQATSGATVPQQPLKAEQPVSSSSSTQFVPQNANGQSNNPPTVTPPLLVVPQPCMLLGSLPICN